MPYKIHCSCISHVGKCRHMNQDNYVLADRYMEIRQPAARLPGHGCIVCNPSLLVGVFDGMGGEEQGEMAAFLAAREAARTHIDRAPFEGLRSCCFGANEQICRYAEAHGHASMGTTAALLAFTDREIGLCNIGDSRIFRFAGGKLEQLSVDHYAIGFPGRKPPLSQNLGIPVSEMVIDPYTTTLRYRDGDVFLLCSDGLTDMVTEAEISRILAETTFDRSADELLRTALERGGRDNITILLCRTERVRKPLFQRIFPAQTERRVGQ